MDNTKNPHFVLRLSRWIRMGKLYIIFRKVGFFKMVIMSVFADRDIREDNEIRANSVWEITLSELAKVQINKYW